MGKNSNVLTAKIQSKFSYYFKSLGGELTAPEVKCVKEMVWGLLKSQTVFINKIAGFLSESIPLKKTCKRLAYHYNKDGFWKKVTHDHLQRVSAKVHHGDYLLFDLSDIQKKYAKMMEGLAFVKDGDGDGSGPGYWLANVIGYNQSGAELVPMYSKLYSFEKGTMSENREIIEAVDMVMGAVKKEVTWVLDRGADRPILIDHFLGKASHFIIRLTKRRKLFYKGEEMSVREISKKVRLKHHAEVEKVKKNKVVKRTYRYGAVKVQYQCQKGKLHDMWLMISKGDGRGYCWCLTNKPFDTEYEAAIETFNGYGHRWKIEEYHRHVKQSYKVESIQVKTFNGLQSVMAILTVAMYFIYREIAALHTKIILEGPLKTIVKNKIRELCNFIYYKISTLIAELLAGATIRQLIPPNYYNPSRQCRMDFQNIHT